MKIRSLLFYAIANLGTTSLFIFLIIGRFGFGNADLDLYLFIQSSLIVTQTILLSYLNNRYFHLLVDNTQSDMHIRMACYYVKVHFAALLFSILILLTILNIQKKELGSDLFILLFLFTLSAIFEFTNQVLYMARKANSNNLQVEQITLATSLLASPIFLYFLYDDNLVGLALFYVVKALLAAILNVRYEMTRHLRLVRFEKKFKLDRETFFYPSLFKGIPIIDNAICLSLGTGYVAAWTLLNRIAAGIFAVANRIYVVPQVTKLSRNMALDYRKVWSVHFAGLAKSTTLAAFIVIILMQLVLLVYLFLFPTGNAEGFSGIYIVNILLGFWIVVSIFGTLNNAFLNFKEQQVTHLRIALIAFFIFVPLKFLSALYAPYYGFLWLALMTMLTRLFTSGFTLITIYKRLSL